MAHPAYLDVEIKFHAIDVCKTILLQSLEILMPRTKFITNVPEGNVALFSLSYNLIYPA